MPVRPATHRASGQARRTALLEAAIAVIAEKGIGGVTHRLVAARAGMPLSTTSYFFASLDELVAAAVQVVADRIDARVNAGIALALDAEPSWLGRIELIVDMELLAPGDDLVTQFEVYLECTRRPALMASAHQIMSRLERLAEISLTALDIDNAAERAPIVVAMLDGLSLHRRVRSRGEADRRELRLALITLLQAFTASETPNAYASGPSQRRGS